ncbi:MAG: peptidoglycan editing factor PgeF [Hyphomicrobiaceae bacterium]
MINGTVLKADTFTGLNGVRHGFFTREGGVSVGDYDSLNVGFGSNDKRDDVAENRRRIAAHLGARIDGQAYPDIVTNYQVHSAEAVIVDAPFGPEAAPKADALVTNRPGLAIGALTADCTPVLFADEEAKVVAAAHAGWRGAVSGVLASAVTAMEQLGAQRARIRAAIGPTIHQDAYEVGPEFKAQFLEQAPGNAQFFVIPPGRKRDHFDLPGYCRQTLEQLGLGRVEDLGYCTYANESLFFSFRRKTHRNECDYGRQIAAIVVT